MQEVNTTQDIAEIHADTDATDEEIELTNEQIAEILQQRLRVEHIQNLLRNPKNKRNFDKLNLTLDRSKRFLNQLFKYDVNHSNLGSKLDPIADKLQDAIVKAEDKDIEESINPHLRRTLLHTLRQCKKDFYRINLRKRKKKMT